MLSVQMIPRLDFVLSIGGKTSQLIKLKSTKIFPFEIEFISLPINISTEQQLVISGFRVSDVT
jgi:hypothetical protein